MSLPDLNHIHKADGGSNLRGTKHWRNKLTEDQAREIKQLLAAGELKQGEIARRFGVSRTLVNEVHMGRAWGWLLA